MPEIKITQMPELLPFDSYTLEGGTVGNEYIPIIDSNETNPSLKNKKIAVSTLFEKYLNAEAVTLEINNAQNGTTTERITLINNTFQVTSIRANYLFMDANGANRNVQIVLFNEGENKHIKNVSSSNTITLQNMVTNNNTVALTYIIPAGKTVHVIYDGVDHHVIPLD